MWPMAVDVANHPVRDEGDDDGGDDDEADGEEQDGAQVEI